MTAFAGRYRYFQVPMAAARIVDIVQSRNSW
jgi:hypothetical protein